MKSRRIYEDLRILGAQFPTRILVGVEVVAPEELSVDEFNHLSPHEQEKYMLEIEEYRAWLGR